MHFWKFSHNYLEMQNFEFRRRKYQNSDRIKVARPPFFALEFHARLHTCSHVHRSMLFLEGENVF